MVDQAMAKKMQLNTLKLRKSPFQSTARAWRRVQNIELLSAMQNRKLCFPGIRNIAWLDQTKAKLLDQIKILYLCDLYSFLS